jgi:repressor LexA
MLDLTKKQQAVRDFIGSELAAARPCPSHREIAAHFGYASSYAAACHIRALVRKGVLLWERGKARSLSLAHAHRAIHRAPVANIPLFGSIPAGFSSDREQEAAGCVTVDIESIGFTPTRNTFALRVTGDSMIEKHICDGDIAVCEHGPEPPSGQVVAALIDRENTLKTFLVKNGKAFLKSENPKYPNLIPSEELVIQGVLRALIRKAGH